MTPSILLHRSLSLVAGAFLVGCASLTETPENPIVPLFNGSDLKGWHVDLPAADDDPTLGPAFIIRDGMLVSLGTPEGHLITDASFNDYRLEVEYRFPGEPGNCGVLVHCSTPRYLFDQFPRSIEVQMHSGNAGDFWVIGEDIRVEDMEERRPGDPSTYGGEAEDSRRILNLTDDSERPVGEWNTMVIECRRDRIDVWVNGVQVNRGFDSTATKGQIAIQAESSEVEFRRLDLRSLKP